MKLRNIIYQKNNISVLNVLIIIDKKKIKDGI